jgi:hypothetical protein
MSLPISIGSVFLFEGCFIEAIGKPVLLRSSPENDHMTAWGAIMRDAYPPTVRDGYKYYITEQFTGRQLIEYGTADDFKSFTPTFKYSLPKTFRGVGHVIYNGSFYYQVDTQVRYSEHFNNRSLQFVSKIPEVSFYLIISVSSCNLLQTFCNEFPPLWQIKPKSH